MCDLDHTLVPEAEKRLRPRTVAALHAARDAGLHVLVATGRMFQSARPFALEARADGPLICYQGAWVADARTGSLLFHHPIELDLAREAIDAIQRAGHGVNCYVDDELYVAEITPEAQFYVDYQGTPIELHPVGDLLAWLERPPTKLVVVGFDGVLDPLEASLREQLGDRLHVVRSLEFFLEVNAKGITKSAGLDIASHELGFSRAGTVGFGDGQNDLELLDWCGYGVAMANAHPNLLRVADLVCPSVDEDGVAQVVEALLAEALPK